MASNTDAPHTRFSMKNLSDEKIYHYNQSKNMNGKPAYEREDNGTVVIFFTRKWGWVAGDGHSSIPLARPWNVHVDDQGEFPPEGDWVEKLGANSCVFELKYIRMCSIHNSTSSRAYEGSLTGREKA